MNHLDPEKRHDFVLLFDAINSNPNGDPNLNNTPRHDPDTGEGIVTNMAIKRKVRDWMVARGKDVIVQNTGQSLQKREEEAGATPDDLREYIDARLFGHVITAKGEHNPIWGPVQISDAVSIDPVVIETQAITRCLPTADGDGGNGMGRRHVVRYGLYKTVGTYSPNRAERVTKDDLEVLYEGLLRGFEHAQSTSRPQVQSRILMIVTHDNEYGNAPRHETTSLLKANSNTDSPRAYEDYSISIEAPPEGTEAVTMEPYRQPQSVTEPPGVVEDDEPQENQ